MNQEEIDAYWAEVKPVVPLYLEYRLHYNELGEIVMGTMTDHPDTTSYIVVTKDEYEQYFHYHIVNGKLVKIDNDAGYRVQLKKSKSGYPTVAGHASLIVEETETYNNLEYYERNN